jgi:hypothetical protein
MGSQTRLLTWIFPLLGIGLLLLTILLLLSDDPFIPGGNIILLLYFLSAGGFFLWLWKPHRSAQFMLAFTVVWFIATSIIYYRTLDMLAVAWILGLSIYGIPGLLMSWLADGAQKASKPIRWFVIAGAVLLVSVVVFCLLVVGLT